MSSGSERSVTESSAGGRPVRSGQDHDFADRLRAARERDRLEAEIDRLQAALDERTSALKRTRAKLDTLTSDPFISTYQRTRRLAGGAARRVRSVGRRAPMAPAPSGRVATETDGRTGPGYLRQLAIKGSDGRIRISVVGEVPSYLASTASAGRWTIVDAAQPAEVALLVDPTRFDHSLPAALRLAWFRAGALPITDDPDRLCDLDGVAADGDRQAELAAETGRCDLVNDEAGLEAWLLDELERPRVGLHIGPADWGAAATWGDTPFARGLAVALRRRGWGASILVAGESDSTRARAMDVAIHLVGRRRPPIHPGQLSVLWIISHPDDVRAGHCAEYSAVFVASDLFAGALRERVSVPVIPLHQATDPHRFFPEAGGPVHELLFVGNSRSRRRPVLDALADGSWDLAVYGSNWRPDWLDPRYLRGTWVPNRVLHRYYAAAAIVLNDHWPDMRQEGFFSNRLYDALASGAFVLTDEVSGLAQEFDGGVATWSDADSLRAAIGGYLEDPVSRHEIAERGRQAVMARHTFDHRVACLMESLAPIATAQSVAWPRIRLQGNAGAAPSLS